MNPLEEIDPTPNFIEKEEDRYEILERVLNIEAFMEAVEGDTDKLYRFLTNPKIRGVKIPVGDPERYIMDRWGEKKYLIAYIEGRQKYWDTYLEARRSRVSSEERLVIKEGDLIAFREENRRK